MPMKNIFVYPRYPEKLRKLIYLSFNIWTLWDTEASRLFNRINPALFRAVNNNLNGCEDFGSCSLTEHAELCCSGLPTPTGTRTPTMTPHGAVPTATATPTPPATATPTTGGACVGDCNGNGEVTVDDLIKMVNIALALQPLCPGDGAAGCLAGDANCDCQITVDDIIRAVNNSLGTCTDFGACTPAAHAAQCCAAE